MAYERNNDRPERGDREGRGDKKSFGGPRRKKTCPFSGDNAPKIDWKDTKQLGRFISERGKIMPARITAVNTTKQRELAQAIKRARYMALIPYIRDEAPSFERYERSDRPARTERFERTEKGE